MPLINKKKSDQAMMKEGKAEKPSLSMAYNVQKMNKKKKMAKGGMVPKGSEADANPGTPAAKPDNMKIPDSESMANHFAEGGDVDHHLSIAESILRKRKMMAEGGEVSDLDQEPLDEQDDHYDEQNMKAAESPLYDDSQLSKDPMDSNEHGDSAEDDSENTLDMIGKIRAKLRKGQS